MAADTGGRETAHPAIWALGIIDRDDAGARTSDGPPLQELVWDEDPEIRAQAIRVLGDAAYSRLEDMQSMLFDEMPRVIFESAIALGKMDDGDSFDAIVEMIRRTARIHGFDMPE